MSEILFVQIIIEKMRELKDAAFAKILSTFCHFETWILKKTNHSKQLKPIVWTLLDFSFFEKRIGPIYTMVETS